MFGATDDERIPVYYKQNTIGETNGTGVVTVNSAITGALIRLKNGKTYENFTIRPMLVRSTVSPTEFVPPVPVQTLAVNTPNGLPGIPVNSGGNYTDESGQRWISDYIDFERGKYVRAVNSITYNGDEGWNTNSNANDVYQFTTGIKKLADGTIDKRRPRMLSNIGVGMQSVLGAWIYIGSNAAICVPSTFCEYDANSFKNWLSQNPVTIIYPLATPVETDLSEEEISAYKALHTNEGTTNVFTDTDAGIELRYVADTKMYIDKRIDTIASTLINSVTGE